MSRHKNDSTMLKWSYTYVMLNQRYETAAIAQKPLWVRNMIHIQIHSNKYNHYFSLRDTIEVY